MKKHQYIVSIPLTGAMYIEVEAESEMDAKVLAWNSYNLRGEKAGEIEWELVDHVTEGNVTHAYLNDIEVDRVRSVK